LVFQNNKPATEEEERALGGRGKSRGLEALLTIEGGFKSSLRRSYVSRLELERN